MRLLAGIVGLVLRSSLRVASMLLLGVLVLSRLVGGLFLRPAGLGGWSRRLGSTGVRLLARSRLARLVWLVLRLLLGPSGRVRLCGSLGAVLTLVGLVRGLLLRPARLSRLGSGGSGSATDLLLPGLGLIRLVRLLLGPARLSSLGGSCTADLLLSGLGLTRLVRRLLLSTLLRVRRSRRARATIKRKSAESSIIARLVLAIVQEVPALDKHATNVLNSRAMEAHGDIGPAHARSLGSIELVLVRVRNVGEVQHAGVVVVLAVEDIVGRVVVDVGKGVLVGVPASVAHVEPAHESHSAVDNAEFLVVGPVEDHVLVDTVDALDGVGGHLAEL